MKILTSLIMICLLAGCYNKAEQETKAGNDFIVARLFVYDGCSVYRFMDGGLARYFTNCAGATQWSETCGKNCHRDVSVSGATNKIND